MEYVARRGGTSQTARIDANVRRRACGVMSAIGSRPSYSSCRFARSRIGARILERMLSGFWRVPFRVGKAG